MQYKLLSLLALASQTAAQGTPNITALLASVPQLSNLTTFVSQFPTLLSTLAGANNNITILAPTNAAFSTFLNTTLGRQAANNTGLLQALLSYHVIPSVVPSSAITNSLQFVPTLLTNRTYTNVTTGQRISARKAGNTVIIGSGNLVSSNVTTADQNFTGGTVHIIDRVLNLPLTVAETATADNLTSLVGAVTTANLVNAVQYTPNITIFAPNNAAFNSVASAFQNASAATLASVLTYHVINGTIGYSSGLMNGQTLPTVNGASLKITIENGQVFVNAAKVIQPDVLVANGVVHVIDNVLNPSSSAATPSPSASGGSPAFSGSATGAAPFASVTPSGGAGGITSSTSSAAAVPMATGAVGMGALFGVGAAMFLGA